MTTAAFPKTVHIIPLGHEIDRAVQPLRDKKIDTVHLLAISPEDDLDPIMKSKQTNYTYKVTEELKLLSIKVQFHHVKMFDILDVLKTVSRIIVQEQKDGNMVYVNMSSCGRKTSFAVTIAAMFHEVTCYYVAADAYATGENAEKEADHGMSIVSSSAAIEFLQVFKIMKPKMINIELLAELYRRNINDNSGMKSDDIIHFLNQKKEHGFRTIPDQKQGYEKSKLRRSLLNRINRSYLKELEDQNYIKKQKTGKEFSICITQAGCHIACLSGLIE